MVARGDSRAPGFVFIVVHPPPSYAPPNISYHTLFQYTLLFFFFSPSHQDPIFIYLFLSLAIPSFPEFYFFWRTKIRGSFFLFLVFLFRQRPSFRFFWFCFFAVWNLEINSKIWLKEKYSGSLIFIKCCLFETHVAANTSKSCSCFL